MKKIVLAMSTIAAVAAAQAGSMGPISMASYTPYLTGEASYTWPQIGSSIVDQDIFTTSSQGWGGRLGAGMMYGYNEKLAFTGEIGGGYYGSRNQNISNARGSVGYSNFSIDGYDLLAGFVYKWNYFDVFLQGGFMMQNQRTLSSINLANVASATPVDGIWKQNAVRSQTLPEIKVGGMYNINPTWAVDLAYMHVFGSTPSVNSSMTTTGTMVTQNSSVVTQNPTLDSVMFGLHYNFVM